MTLNSSKLRTVGLVLALLVVLCGCEYGELGVVSGPNIGAWDTVGLTYDVNGSVVSGRDSFIVAGGHDYVSVSAPLSNVGGNTRLAFANAGAVATPGGGGEVCATFDGESQARAQEGLLLGWDVGAGRGVTLTKNVYGPAWFLNLHEWNHGSYTLVASWDVPALHVWSMPYRLCARRDGELVRFRSWKEGAAGGAGGGVEGLYEDPFSGGSGRVSGVSGAGGGLFGWYAGHLEAGHALSYRSLDVVVW